MKNKIFSAFLALLVSFGLWLYVISVVSPGSENTYYNIPVNIQNESILTDRGLMITENKNPTVTLHLVGDRVDLNKLNSSNITITVDASRIYEAGRHNLSYNITYPGEIADNAISVQSRSTSTISLMIEERISKAVDVTVEYIGQLSPDYICDMDNAVLTNEVVNIVGPKSVVDLVSQAKVEVKLENKAQTISQEFPYVLCGEDGKPVDEKKLEILDIDVESIGFTVKINRIKEIPLHLTVIPGAGATEQTASIKKEMETIWVAGTEEALEKLDALELGTVDLGTMLEPAVLTFPIVLPEGVEIVLPEGSEAELTEIMVDIQFPDLATKKLSVTDIKFINYPEAYDVELCTQQLEITFRGPAELIKALTAKDVTAQVDFAGLQEGPATLKAEIKISEAYAAIDVTHADVFSVVLRKPAPIEPVIHENIDETVKG